jgi:hypothetical protein
MLNRSYSVASFQWAACRLLVTSGHRDLAAALSPQSRTWHSADSTFVSCQYRKWANLIRSPRRRGANTPRPAKAGRHRPDREQVALAALGGRDVAGGDLVFVGGEGCQDFGLLGLRDLEEGQGPSEFRCDLIEFCGGDPEVPVGLL